MIKKLNKTEWLNLLWLMATGLIIAGMSLKICRMAHFFVFGVDHVHRPIPEMVLYLGIWFIAYFFALERVRKISNPDSAKINLVCIFLVSAVIRVVFFPPHPIQETDPYRYLWDGQAVIQGANPYRLSPQEAYTLNAKPALSKDEDVTAVFERVNARHIRTIYPPLAQYLFAVSQYLAPWSLLGWKWMIIAADILTLLVLFALLVRLKIRGEWILLYAWSPLVLKEFYNSMHLDIFALLFLCLMIYGLTRKWTTFSFIALACAVMVKWFALILLPLLIRFTWNTSKRACLNIGLFLGFIIFAYLPFISAGGALWEGLTAFSLHWRVNDGVFSLILFTFQLFPLSEDLAKLASRFTALLFFILISGIAIRRFGDKKDVLSFCRAALITTASLFFLAPAGNPWYFTWTFPFLVFWPTRSLIIFSGLVLLYYLDFYFMYQGQGHLFAWVCLIEYGTFFAFLGYELWKNRRLPLLSRSTTRAIPS